MGKNKKEKEKAPKVDNKQPEVKEETPAVPLRHVRPKSTNSFGAILKARRTSYLNRKNVKHEQVDGAAGETD